MYKMLQIVIYYKFDMFVSDTMFFVALVGLTGLTAFSIELIFSHELSTTTESII